MEARPEREVALYTMLKQVLCTHIVTQHIAYHGGACMMRHESGREAERTRRHD
jgi:hypothetical protein